MAQKLSIQLIIIFSFLGIVANSYAQTIENSCDTVSITAPAFLVLSDTTIHVDNDSTAIICSKYIVISKKGGYSLYSRIVGETQKREFVNRLFQLLIVSSTQDTMLINNNLIKAEDAYKPYAGKVIRNIKIQVLKPFGPSLSDTNLPVVTTLSEALNKSHFSTRKSTIKRKLLFKKGEAVDPYELVENTNELAGLPFLQDATIILSDATNDSVDVLVLVKDKFPWLPLIDVRSIRDMTLSLKHVNMFGLGQSLQVGVTMDTESSPLLYVSNINYSYNNIYNQINGAVNYSISDYNQKYQILLNRDIIPLSVRLGGGLEITQQEENIVIDPKNIDQSRWYFKYRYYELWSSYLLYNKTVKNVQNNNYTFIIPGIAVSKMDYLYRPFVSIDSNSIYANYTQLLGNIAIAKQNYIRTNFLLSFGKAEYLPYGFQATLTTGYTWCEFSELPYLGVGFALTSHFDNFGYVSGNLQMGSHISENLEQGAINLNMAYLSALILNNRYRYRFLTTLNYTTGINRITNDLLYLGEDYGFIGMKDEAFYGQERLFLELYGISYTPWYFLGFRFAAFGFCTAGILGDEDKPILRNKLLTSFGLGLYTQNDFLAFSSLQIRVAYFPNTPNGISHFGISFSSIGLFESSNFLKSKPQVVDYR